MSINYRKKINVFFFFFFTETGKFDVRDMEGFFLRLLGPRLFCKVMLDNVFTSEGLQAFLNDRDSKFDMVITETFFCQEPFIALGHKYGAIQVSVQTVNIFMGLSRISGNPHNPAYVPSSVYPSSRHMNFWERSKSTFANLLDYTISHVIWFYLVRTFWLLWLDLFIIAKMRIVNFLL